MKKHWIFTIVYGVLYPVFLGVLDYILYLQQPNYDMFMIALFTMMHIAYLPVLVIIYNNHKYEYDRQRQGDRIAEVYNSSPLKGELRVKRKE